MGSQDPHGRAILRRDIETFVGPLNKETGTHFRPTQEQVDLYFRILDLEGHYPKCTRDCVIAKGLYNNTNGRLNQRAFIQHPCESNDWNRLQMRKFSRGVSDIASRMNNLTPNTFETYSCEELHHFAASAQAEK